MSEIDLAIINARLVSSGGIRRGSVLIQGEQITGIVSDAKIPSAKRVIDAQERHVIPGVVDPHTHPGCRNPLDQDFRDESPAAAAGGVTTYGVMVGSGRASWTFKEFVTVDDTRPWTEAFPVLREMGEDHSTVDFFHSPTINTEEQVEEIPEIARRFGVTSFKFYPNLKSHATTNIVPKWKMRIAVPASFDDGLIWAGFEQIGRLGPAALAMVHNENTEVTTVLMKRLIQEGRRDIAAWTDRCPPWCESEHLVRYALFAEQAGCRLYGLHISTRDGLDACTKLKRQGVPLTVETCPQYLLATTDSPAGLLLKVNPPIRDRHHNDSLWQGVMDGRVECIGSDHVVTNYEEKMVRGDSGDREGDEIDDVWSAGSGFVGMEILLPLLLSEGVHKRGIPLERIVQICCENTARTFGLYPKKGSWMVGADADLVILDMDREVALSGDKLHGFGDFTLFEGLPVKGWPITTICRGSVVFENGEVTGKSGYGRYLARDPESLEFQVRKSWDPPG